jgi:serine protease AprX
LASSATGLFQMLRSLILTVVCAAAGVPQAVAAGATHAGDARLDAALRRRAHAPEGHSRIILTVDPGVQAVRLVQSVDGVVGRRLASLGGIVADVPDTSLDSLAALPGVRAVSLDRPIEGTLERTGATIGSPWVHDRLGLDGTGIGVAIIDSGVTGFHDDLPPGRVVKFADFVNFQPEPYDDYGHGTHVAGIIAGSGYDSGGRRQGIAPGASLIVEKVLDATGEGFISNVIAAIDYAVANKDTFHIRVINLSVAAGVYESFNTDPLALAARRAVEAGIVVVSAAGNLGRNAKGWVQYGGIGAPGNAPWVIAVGASSHMGTVDRRDDTVAAFSSRGPGAIDFAAKPDLVAPGVGIESLADAGSTLFATKPTARLWGTVATATEPYLSLTGTSMASPVVSGTIALMLQANPTLTPNLVKAILQYTAESKRRYDGLTQGGGFLNARGAVELARSLASGESIATSHQSDPTRWSRHIVWGNHRLGNGLIEATATAWRTDVVWGAPTTPDGRNVTWGTSCTASDCSDLSTTGLSSDRLVWGTSSDGENIVWGTTAAAENIVWGTACGGADCAGPDVVWSASRLDTLPDIVWPAEPVRRRVASRRTR